MNRNLTQQEIDFSNAVQQLRNDIRSSELRVQRSLRFVLNGAFAISCIVIIFMSWVA